MRRDASSTPTRRSSTPVPTDEPDVSISRSLRDTTVHRPSGPRPTAGLCCTPTEPLGHGCYGHWGSAAENMLPLAVRRSETRPPSSSSPMRILRCNRGESALALPLPRSRCGLELGDPQLSKGADLPWRKPVVVGSLAPARLPNVSHWSLARGGSAPLRSPGGQSSSNLPHSLATLHKMILTARSSAADRAEPSRTQRGP